MLKVDITQVQDYGDTFFSPTDTAYLIFMIIGIVGYFTVPSVANYIVHAGGGNTLLYKVTSLIHRVAHGVLRIRHHLAQGWLLMLLVMPNQT